jgi:hypothetical protein
MSFPRPRLTDGLIADIASRVQSGAFPAVAAEAVGVPAAVFAAWMKRGDRPGARDPYRSLAQRVRRAHAHARCMAEVALRGKEPKVWLLNGPGRHSAEAPGWSAPARAPADPKGRGGGVLLEPQLQAVLATLLAALEAYPEARTALGAMLAEQQAGEPPETEL